jgi:hypothetical protein
MATNNFKNFQDKDYSQNVDEIDYNKFERFYPMRLDGFQQ